MFANINRTKAPNGGVYEYVRILETYYENGKHKQRVVANLGRVDRNRDDLARLAKKFAALSGEPLAAPGDLDAEQILSWGQVLVTRHLYDEIGLGKLIAQHCRSPRRQFDVAETAFVLIANRLADPASEHGLARWLENTYVCDPQGRRWVADRKPVEAITKEQRVQVEPRQLNIWYRTLDALLRCKESIERDLYFRVRDLFHMNVDMVLYDVTNTYFTRRTPKGELLRNNAASKQGKSRNVHVTLGVVLANGWPIAHHVFPGNTADKATLQKVVADLENRFGLRRVLVVGDRGMVSEENLEFLSQAGREATYLLAIPGRRSKEAAAVFAALRDDAWANVDKHNRVQQVVLDDSGVRHFVVDSDERREYEEGLRKKSMVRAAEELRKVETAVAAGRLKDPTKIAARAAAAFARNHAKRYYSYDAGLDGTFRFWEDPVKLAAETVREGRYILKTDDPTILTKDSVALYKQLSDVEWAYRELKDVIKMRPIHHQTDPRIEAHLFVATLALFLKRTLEHHLQDKHIALTSSQALEAVKSMGAAVVEFNDKPCVLTSKGSRDAKRVMKTLGIGDISPAKEAAGQTRRK